VCEGPNERANGGLCSGVEGDKDRRDLSCNTGEVNYGAGVLVLDKVGDRQLGCANGMSDVYVQRGVGVAIGWGIFAEWLTRGYPEVGPWLGYGRVRFNGLLSWKGYGGDAVEVFSYLQVRIRPHQDTRYLLNRSVAPRPRTCVGVGPNP